jgi:hypothetical protein
MGAREIFQNDRRVGWVLTSVRPQCGRHVPRPVWEFADQVQSKYPPAKPGALERWPLKAAGGVADATPGQVATKVAGQRQRLNFTDIAHLFLVPDTGPSDLFILFNCRYEMPACPEALTNPHLQRMTLSPWIKPGTRETSRFGGIAIILGTFVWSCRTDAGVSSTDNRGLYQVA